jgi:TonB family protein
MVRFPFCRGGRNCVWAGALAGAVVLSGFCGDNDFSGPGCATDPVVPLVAPPPLPLAGANAAAAKLGVWIREDGAVDEVAFLGGSEAWREGVIGAVRQWRFTPVVWRGQALPARVEVDLEQQRQSVNTMFLPLPNLPGELHSLNEFGLVAPVRQLVGDPVVPLQVRIDRAMHNVSLRYVIEADGTTGRFEPLAARREDVLRAMLDWLAAQRYAPASIRKAPVAVLCDQDATLAGVNEAIPGLEGATDLVDPVYPFARLFAGEEGKAKVHFTLRDDGSVEKVEVLEASHPDFGGALVAAVEAWKFSPAAAAEQRIRDYEHNFVPESVSYAARRLVDFVRGGGTLSNSAAGLDARPQVQARPALVYPRALLGTRPEGVAQIEIVIDRAGLAQLPRVVQASQPEFGWAGAACAGSMRFKPLTRGGKAVDLRVVLPLKFLPPPVASSQSPVATGVR